MATNVLVPMDDSPPSTAALEHALSEHAGAAITVLHVVDNTYVAAYGDGMVVPEQRERVSERTTELFAEARRVADEHGVDLATVSERGSPARTIIDYADEHGIDRIVMGSHGREGVTRLLLGSVAERVIRRASVPVTVVR